MKKLIRNALLKIRKPVENALLNFPVLNYYIKDSLGKSDAFELALGLYIKKFINKSDKPFFIQIGANNGVTNDPLYKFIIKYNLSGILVEPVPHLFDQLKRNYGNRKGLFFENVAIGNPRDQLTFYRVKSDKHMYYDQLGSFSKETILKNKKTIRNLEALIVEEPVQVIDFNSLVKKYQKKKVDILIMDTEGYDAEIIKMIDFDKIDFDLVLFENKHLTPSDHNFCMDLLKTRNFKSIVNKSDTLCIKNDLVEISALAEKLNSKIS